MKRFILILLAAMLALGLASCKKKTDDSSDSLAGSYDITMWVSEKEGVAEHFKEQISEFTRANPDISINFQIEGVTEADVGSKIVADVASAPDIYCFAQDQLARLVQAGALAKIGKTAGERVSSENDASSVSAAQVSGALYAYPITSDNGYFLYYDKSIISDEEADSLEDIIAACEKNGKKFRFALEDGWYTASFFFATGCRSEWTVGEKGAFLSLNDNFNSPEGLVAMKGMQKLVKSSCYDSDANSFVDTGAIVTGIWNADAAGKHFGENLGATDLPSFTVDGKEYHLGSYTGNKLIGVKPQSDAKRSAVLSLLAEYLSGEKCQKQRYEVLQWGPSNINAQKSDRVQANASLAALAKQSEHGRPQGQVAGSWWDIVRVLGAEAKRAKDDAELQAALDRYNSDISKWHNKRS